MRIGDGAHEADEVAPLVDGEQTILNQLNRNIKFNSQQS